MSTGRMLGRRAGAAAVLVVALSAPDTVWAARGGTTTQSLGEGSHELVGEPGGQAGFRVARAGDLDGDGYDDLAVGAWLDGTGGAGAGAVYVIYGPVGSDALLSSAGAKLHGVVANGFAGEALAAGDVDGDGYDDLMVGAPGIAPHQPGTPAPGVVYVVHGGPSRLSGTIPLPAVSGSLVGEEPYDNAGISLDAADLDGDGFDDLVVGGAGWSGMTGKVWVVYGGQRVAGATPLGTAAAAQLLGDGPGAAWGSDVAAGSDLDGDSFPDLAIGAQAAGLLQGAVQVVYGGPQRFGGTALLAVTGVRFVGAPSDFAGADLATGDVDGDGIGDLAVAAHQAPLPDPALNGPGVAYVVYGGGRFAGGSLPSVADAIVRGEAPGDAVRSVAIVPGFGDDGPRLVVGAFLNDRGGADAGAVYVVPMKHRGRTVVGTVELGTAKLTLLGEAAGDLAALTAAASVDGDGDGDQDLLVGAPGHDDGGTAEDNRGSAYLVLGS